jgi:hypothetical protein
MSLTLQIRDGAYDRIVKAFKPFKSVRKIPMTPVQPDQVPALGVFFVNEDMGPDGDDNVATPRFISDVVIGISVLDTATKSDVLEGSIDKVGSAILDTLLCDPTFLDLRDVTTNQPIIESIPRIKRSHSVQKNGEAYYLELQLQMTFRYRCYFEPVAPNLLTTVAVTVQPPNDAAGDTNTPKPDNFSAQIDLGS